MLSERDRRRERRAGARREPGAPATPPGLALAGALGNQGMQRLARAYGQLQRYRDLSADLANPQGAQFVTQPTKPEILDKPESPGRLPYDFGYPRTQHPTQGLPLNVADDDTMAIHNTASEPKEFYAHPAVIRNANERLDTTDSAFRLEPAGGQVTVGDLDLLRLRPVNVRRANDDPQRYEDMLQNICVRMAGEVMGTRGSFESEVVLGTGGQDSRSFPIRPGPTKDTRIKSLTTHLAQGGQTTPDIAADATATDPTDSQIEAGADEYGRQAGSGALDDTAQDLGINQFIRPKAGEGLATFGNPGKDPTQDFSVPTDNQGTPTQRGETWGYHFAGVVATSMNGDDYVTLENYNRGIDMEHKLVDLQKRVLERYFSTVGIWWNGRAITEKDSDTDIREKFKSMAKEVTQKEGALEYFRLQRDAEPNTAWFFRMYGTLKKEQTYHHRQATSGEFVNALSTRVRKRDPWVEAVGEDLVNVDKQLIVTDFDPNSQAGVQQELSPIRAQLTNALISERQLAEQAADEGWSNIQSGEGRFDWSHTRYRLVTTTARALRHHLYGLERQGSQGDQAAAKRLLAALEGLGRFRVGK